MQEPLDDTKRELQSLRETLEQLRRRIDMLEERASRSPAVVETMPVALRHEIPESVPPELPPAPAPAEEPILLGAPLEGFLRSTRTLQPPKSSSASLETMIGQNWASWIGGIVLFFGVVFFLKYAWDQGWIRPSPTARVAAAIVSGVALAGAGEWAQRKRLGTLAGALHGAGVAVIIASFFAANVYFEPPVMSRVTAFVAVAITAGAAIALSLHINSITLAMLALIGAYLSPFVLRSGQDQSAVLLSYLGVLAAVGWVLSYFNVRWIPLRWLVFACTYLSVAAWWFNLGQRNDHHALLLWWSCIFYAGFLVELVLTLRRHRDPSDEAAEAEADPLAPRLRSPLHSNLALLSLLVTAATFGLLAAALHPAHATLGAFALVLAATQVAAVLLTPSIALRVSGVLQAAALVTLSVPLMLDQFAITIAWVLLASVLALLARQLALPAVRGWAALLLILAVIRLFIFDQFNPTLQAVQVHILEQPVSRWLLLGWTIAVMFHVMAWLTPKRSSPPVSRLVSFRAFATIDVSKLDYASAQPSDKEQVSTHEPGGALLAVLGTFLFVSITLMRWNGPMLTLALIAWLAPIALLARAGRQIGYGLHAAIFAALVSARWLMTDNFWPLMQTWNNGNSSPPILNLPALCGLLLAAATLLVCWDEKLLGIEQMEDNTQLPIRTLAIVWAGVIGLALINFELWRAIDLIDSTGTSDIADRGIVKHVAMSVLWAIIGFAGVVFGFRRRIAEIRWASLALLAITLVKIMVVDMAEVKAIWRILSFVAVGVLLLAVSFVYHRQVAGTNAE